MRGGRAVNLHQITLFQDLNQEELSLVAAKVAERVFPKGVTLFVEGQETDGLYIIKSGLVKVYMLHRDGREKTLAILTPGDVLGEMTVYGSDLRSATVETLELTTFLIINKVDFRSLLFKIPKISISMIEMISNRLRQANRQIQELSFMNSRSRVICNLLHLAEEHGKIVRGEIGIPLRLTHAELGKLAGVSRETVTKVLVELQDNNLIDSNNKQLRVLEMVKRQREVM